MSDLQENEAKERFMDSLKLAASRAREMGVAQNLSVWSDIAASLDGLRKKGMHFMRNKALTRDEVIHELDRQRTDKIEALH